MIQDARNRLDRLETLAETTLLAIQQLAVQQRQIQSDLTLSVSDVVSMVGELGNQMSTFTTHMEEMQSEIRGLQLENRRILEELASRRQTDGGEGQ